MWTQQQAINLCKEIEKICPEFGCHVALTGGCLYKQEGYTRRKDVDIIFYRIRQEPFINITGLFSALNIFGIINIKGFGWLYKAEYCGKNIDILFPEEECGIYQGYYETEQIEIGRIIGMLGL